MPKKEAEDWLQAATEVIGNTGVKLPAGFSDLMKQYKRGFMSPNLGPTDEQAVIRHLAEVSPDGFASLRGEKADDNLWESVISPIGAVSCRVDWTDNEAKEAKLQCNMLQDASRDEAQREFLRLRGVVASSLSWREARREAPAEDHVRIFIEAHAEGKSSRSVLVRFDPQENNAGKYHVVLQFWSTISQDRARETSESNRRSMAGWVADDIHEYIAAAAKGFDSYKKGQPRMFDGARWWDSSVKPVLAVRCGVKQEGEVISFECLVVQSPYCGEIEVRYRGLVADVAAALPNWTIAAKPPYFDMPYSIEFRSPNRITNRMTGQIWVIFGNGEYQLNGQLMAGPR
jgi:hypothetical protein